MKRLFSAWTVGLVVMAEASAQTFTGRELRGGAPVPSRPNSRSA